MDERPDGPWRQMNFSVMASTCPGAAEPGRPTVAPGAHASLTEWVPTGTFFDSYIQIYGMVKTIRVSEEYHAWLAAHKREDETMEETLRRMTRGPHPDDVAGLLSPEEATEARNAVSELRGRDRDRLETARESFEQTEE